MLVATRVYVASISRSGRSIISYFIPERDKESSLELYDDENLRQFDRSPSKDNNKSNTTPSFSFAFLKLLILFHPPLAGDLP